MIPVITESVKLDHCYVCLCSGDEGNKLHEHHVVPRAYGGADGPTVTICSSHHSGVHDAALACYPNKTSKMNKWLERLPLVRGAHERFFYLVSTIMRARAMMSKDVNKKGSVSTSLSAADNRKLDQICDHLSFGKRSMTRADAVTYAIRDLHRRLGIQE